MRRPLPVWLLAALPATLVGHAIAYALTGQSMADPRHGYFGPSLEFAAGFFLALCIVLVLGALTRAGAIARVRVEARTLPLWLKLAPLQVALFCALERAEGLLPSLAGCGVQIALALLLALTLASFARVLARCVRAASVAATYLQRLRGQTVERYLRREPVVCAYALSVRAGSSRFGRPPPRP